MGDLLPTSPLMEEYRNKLFLLRSDIPYYHLTGPERTSPLSRPPSLGAHSPPPPFKRQPPHRLTPLFVRGWRLQLRRTERGSSTCTTSAPRCARATLCATLPPLGGCLSTGSTTPPSSSPSPTRPRRLTYPPPPLSIKVSLSPVVVMDGGAWWCVVAVCLDSPPVRVQRLLRRAAPGPGSLRQRRDEAAV